MKDEKVDHLACLGITDIRPNGDKGLYLGRLENGSSVFLKDRHDIGREGAAYHLSRDLGFDLVPPTTTREVTIDGERRVVAVQDDIFADPRAVEIPPLDHFSEDDLLRAAVFDTLVLATDRLNHNWAGVESSPHWQLLLFDHNNCFGAHGSGGSDIRRRMVGTPLPRELVARLREYGRRFNRPSGMSTRPGEEPWRDLLARLDDLVNHPVIAPEPWAIDGKPRR